VELAIRKGERRAGGGRRAFVEKEEEGGRGWLGEMRRTWGGFAG